MVRDTVVPIPGIQELIPAISYSAPNNLFPFKDCFNPKTAPVIIPLRGTNDAKTLRCILY
jgi:hypothetical protein